METSKPYAVLKDNFEVILSKTDTDLKIEAKDQSTGYIFQGEFSIGAIKQMTDNLFDNVPEFFEGLLAGLQEKSTENTVRVLKGGKLVFTKKLMLGKQEKMLNLTIPLMLIGEEEDEEELSGSLEEQIQRLFREMKKLKTRNLELKKETQQLKEELRCNYELISPNFEVRSWHEESFQVNSLKSVTRIGGKKDQKVSINCEEKLSRTRNTKFRVRIDSFKEYVAVGVTTRVFLTNPDWIEKEGSYCIVTPVCIKMNGGYTCWTNHTRFVAGSYFGVLFIPSQNVIEFDIDGRLVYTAKLRPEHYNVDFYPIVGLHDNGDRVTILEINE